MEQKTPKEQDSGSSSFLNKAARLATGHAVGYVVAFTASPLLARIYEPDAFGVYAIYAMAVSCLGVVATLRLDQAIPLASGGRRASQLGSLTLLVAVVFSTCLLVSSSAFSKLSAMCGVVDLPAMFFVLVAVGVLTFAGYQMVAAIALREKTYRTLAEMRVAFALCSTISHIAIPLAGGSLLLGLPAGQAVGFGCGCLVGARKLRTAMHHRCLLAFNQFTNQISTHRTFTLYGVPAVVLSNLGTHLPVFLLAALFGLEEAGIYAFAQRIFTTPLTLLTNSFSRVYYSEGSEALSGGNLATLFHSTAKKALVLAAIPILSVALLAPTGFGILFGQAWETAGWVCSILSPMVLAFSLSMVVSPTYDLAGQQKQRLYGESLCMTLVSSGIFLGWIIGWSFLGTVLLASLGGATGYGLLFWGAMRSSQQLPAPAKVNPPMRAAA